jgi:hypothetical protein
LALYIDQLAKLIRLLARRRCCLEVVRSESERVAFMALPHRVVRHVCFSVVDLAGMEIRLAGVEIAAFSVVARCVPCGGVRV